MKGYLATAALIAAAVAMPSEDQPRPEPRNYGAWSGNKYDYLPVNTTQEQERRMRQCKSKT